MCPHRVGPGGHEVDEVEPVRIGQGGERGPQDEDLGIRHRLTRGIEYRALHFARRPLRRQPGGAEREQEGNEQGDSTFVGHGLVLQ